MMASEKTRLVISMFTSFELSSAPPLRNLNISTDKMVPAETETIIMVILLLLLIIGVKTTSFNHQIAASQIAIVKPAQYFKAFVIVNLPQILCCNKCTGINIGKVNHIDSSCNVGG